MRNDDATNAGFVEGNVGSEFRIRFFGPEESIITGDKTPFKTREIKDKSFNFIIKPIMIGNKNYSILLFEYTFTCVYHFNIFVLFYKSFFIKSTY